MTKRERTVVFMLVATIANILFTAALFVGFIVLYSLTLGRFLKVGTSGLAIGLSFVLSVVVSSIAYKKVLDALRKRPGFEERYGFGPRR